MWHKEIYKSAEIRTCKETYTDKVFCNHIARTQEDMLDNILNAGKVLNTVKEQPNKGAFKNALADYIVGLKILTGILTGK